NVTADDGVAFNGNISVTLPDNTTVSVEIVNGSGIVPWSVPDDFEEGDYPVNATFDGDDNYLPSNGTGVVTVEKIPTHISVDNVAAHPGDDVNISVNVTADDGVAFNGNISVTLPDNTTVSVEIVNGSGVVPWSVPDDFEEGVYPTNASFEGEGMYLPSNGTGTVTVEKIPTHISIENVTAYPGDDVNISVNVTADDGVAFNGNISFTLPDNRIVSVEIVNGSGVVPWTVPDDFEEGVYPTNASFEGEGRYLPSNGTGTVTVIPKIPTEITVGNVTARPGDNVTIPVNVTADDGVPFNGNISVTLPDNKTVPVEIVNGTGSVPWTVPDDFEEGDYPVNATFDGDDNYLPSNGTGTVSVEKIPTHIGVDNVTAHPGDDVVIPVNVTADDDVPFNGNITVILPDGSNQTVVIVNGTGNVNWTVPDDFEEGDYPVNASFEGDIKYLPSNGTGVVTVEKIPTHTTVGNVTAHPGDNVTIPVNVTADDGIPFNGNVTVTLPDGTTQTVEIINGTGNANWTIPKENVSQYNDSASFGGDNKYLPSNGTGIISVILVDVQLNITVDKSVVYYGEIVEFTITVRNNGPGDATNVTAVNLIPEGFVYISDNCSDVDYQNTKGLLMASSATQSYDPSTGVWYIGDLANGEETKLTILAYANFVGTKQVNSSVSIAEFETDYTNNNDSVEVTVEKVPTEVSVENITTKPGKDITIPINVTAEDSVPINGNVTVELPDGTNKTVEITNGTGETTWTVPSDYAGDYNYTVSYGGNDTYLPSNNPGIITVTPKVPVNIIVGNITAKPGDNVSVPIDVIPEDGSVFNGNVTVTLPDGTTKVVEIINGKGTVDWTIPDNYDGVYPVSVTFDGDDTYLPSNGTGFITVIPDTPVNPDVPVTPDTPENAPAKGKVPMENKATGNPLIALLMVLALLGVGIKRKN
uniref:hypothetical protein n=1 Tax=Methanobrevibacter sp. TaxID=66852 RepID=UPI00388F9DE8